MNNLQRQVLALQDLIYGSEALESDLNMGKNRITKLAHPRNPKDNTDYERDVYVLNISMTIFFVIAERKFLQANKDNVLAGRLVMKQHKINGLADPVES